VILNFRFPDIYLVEGLQQDGLDPLEAIPFLIRKANQVGKLLEQHLNAPRWCRFRSVRGGLIQRVDSVVLSSTAGPRNHFGERETQPCFPSSKSNNAVAVHLNTISEEPYRGGFVIRAAKRTCDAKSRNSVIS